MREDSIYPSVPSFDENDEGYAWNRRKPGAYHGPPSSHYDPYTPIYDTYGYDHSFAPERLDLHDPRIER